MDSSYTNAFFVRVDCSDWPESSDYGYQEYFCKKYKMTGEQLSETMDNMPFLKVGTKEYEDAFQRSVEPRTGIDLATTYTAQGYKQHAHKFLESFQEFWPDSVKLYCFEEPYLEKVDPDALNILEYDLNIHAPELTEFKAYCSDPRKRGLLGDQYNYVFDAVRWSHRIFALAAAARMSDAEILINIDSDIVSFADVTESFIYALLGDADIAYMPRQGMYSECSFVIYRLDNPRVQQFIQQHERFYTNRGIFRIKEGWTDCHAFDVMVKEYTDLKFIDINRNVPPSMHPFVNGPLGTCMDHLKGGRKKEGRSRVEDLVVKRTEEYWQQ